MKKVIFLDIDGVLNVIPEEFDKFGGVFHQNFVDNLGHIIEHTGADIVISSSWRHSGLIAMQEMWKHRAYPGKVIDVTPSTVVVGDSEDTFRGHEIDAWLQQNPVDRYVILDDDNDMLPEQLSCFVRCWGNMDHPDCIDIGYGLTKQCAEAAIVILNT